MINYTIDGSLQFFTMKNNSIHFALLILMLITVKFSTAQNFRYSYGMPNQDERGDGLTLLNNGELLLYGNSQDDVIFHFINSDGTVNSSHTFHTNTVMSSLIVNKILFDNDSLIYGAGFGRVGAAQAFWGILFCYDISNHQLVWYNEMPDYRFKDLDFFIDNAGVTRLLTSGKLDNSKTNSGSSARENTHHGVFDLNGVLIDNFENFSNLDGEADQYNSTIVLDNTVISTGRLNLVDDADDMRLSITEADVNTGAILFNNVYITPLPPTDGRTYGTDLIRLNDTLFTLGYGNRNGTTLNSNSDLYLIQSDLGGQNIITHHFDFNQYLRASALKEHDNLLYISALINPDITNGNTQMLLIQYDFLNNVITQARSTQTTTSNFEYYNALCLDNLQIINDIVYLTGTIEQSSSSDIILYSIPLNELNESCGLDNISISVDTLNLPVNNFGLNAHNEIMQIDSFLPPVNEIIIPPLNECCPDTLLQLTNTVNPNCFNGTDGSIQVQGINGVPLYNFTLYDGASFPSIAIGNNQTGFFNNLPAGFYIVTVGDSVSCADTLEVNLTAPDSIMIQGDLYSTTCGKSNGSINLNISGGTPPYIFNWTGPNGFTSNLEDLQNLSPGNYGVTVVDNNQCSNSAIFEINPSIDPGFGLNLNDSIFCMGDLFCFEIIGDAGSFTVTINNQSTIFTDFPLPFELNPFCNEIDFSTMPDFNEGNNTICAFFYNLDSTCLDTFCIDFFIQNPEAILSVPDTACQYDEVIITYGGSPWGELYIYHDGTLEQQIWADHSSVPPPYLGQSSFNFDEAGIYEILYVGYASQDSFSCSDTVSQTILVENCCDYEAELIVSDSVICQEQEFTFSFGPSSWHQTIFTVDGIELINPIIESSSDPDFDPNTGMITGTTNFSDLPSGVTSINITMIVFENDTLGCSDTLMTSFTILDCDSTEELCEDYDNSASFTYVIDNNGLISLTDNTGDSVETPDYVTWITPGGTFNANPYETVSYQTESSESIEICMIATWFLYAGDTSTCCFDTICQTIQVNSPCIDLNTELEVILSVDPFDPLHYYFENLSTPSPASNYMWSVDGGSFVTSYDNTFDYYFLTEGEHSIIARTVWHLDEDSNLCCIEDLVINFIITDSIDCSVIEENISIDVSPFQNSTLTNRQFDLIIPNGLVMQVNSIHWDFDDGIQSFSTPPNLEYSIQHQYQNSGIYQVCTKIVLVANNGIECIITKCLDIKVYPFSITPNPAEKQLKLNFDADESGNIYSFQIIDANGKQIITQDFLSRNTGLNQEKINVSHLETGIYLINFFKENTLIGTEKFIKK